MYGTDCHCTITAVEIERALENLELIPPYQIGMEDIHEFFIKSKSEEEIKELQRDGYLDEDLKAAWVIHYNHDNISLSTIQMLIRDYASDSKKSGGTDKVTSTTIITKSRLPGRAGDIESLTHSHKVKERYMSYVGFNVPLVTRPYNSYLRNVTDHLGSSQKPIYDVEREVNLDLTFHVFTHDGNEAPTITHKFEGDKVTKTGSCLVYSVLYPQDNARLKKLFVELSETNKTTGVAHFKIRYINEADSPFQVNIDRRHLTYGRFREILVELQPKSKDIIIGLLNKHGAFLGPQSQRFYNAGNFFKLTSKHFITFPTELEKLRENFKSITILDRCKFQVELKEGQASSEVPALLEFSQPSEHESLCLNTKDNSPWLQLDIGERSVLLNNNYTEEMPVRHNTVYISGFDSLFDAEFVEQFVRIFSKLTVDVVDKLELTDESNVQARFLQDMNADKKSRNTAYILAISSNNQQLMDNLKHEISQACAATCGRHSVLTSDIQKLKLATVVLSSTTVNREHALFKVQIANLLDPIAQNGANRDKQEAKMAKDSSAEKQQEFTTVLRDKKRKKKGEVESSPPSKQNGSQQNSNKVNRKSDKKSSNRYEALLADEREEKQSSNPANASAREEEDGDFDNVQDTLVKCWIKNKIIDVEDMPQPTPMEFRSLHELLVSHVSISTPEYHTKTSMPSWFVQKESKQKLIGLGAHVLQYLKATDDKDEGKYSTISKILLSRMSPADRTGRIAGLRTDIRNAVNLMLRKKKSEKDKEAAQRAGTEPPASNILAGQKRQQPSNSPIKSAGQASTQSETETLKKTNSSVQKTINFATVPKPTQQNKKQNTAKSKENKEEDNDKGGEDLPTQQYKKQNTAESKETKEEDDDNGGEDPDGKQGDQNSPMEM